ncbi:histidinol dehydrogenase [Synoicihabitans lomoniglobus]|uniref:Histidinol dehydrogenase n=1 Tax=Synoicihabitans lomoniglobus TaxID=2909285 RepID=A0AAF0CP89_9BACT|nr:histidinol dehydrogenase [Opitutaceae bacterium LMO-M01]WED65645.1 histidinol dehydrogenase [Opitutaceae bacterium LMO-M01]
MRLLNYSSPSSRRALSDFCQESAVPPEITQSVAAILADVRVRGDAAVVDYARKFDGVTIKPAGFRVRPASLAAAAKRLPAAEMKAMKAALANVKAFNRQGMPTNWTGTNAHGAEVGERHHPIRRVGLYVPGGEVPLVSTVLMTATLAKIAGCPEIAVFTPSDAKGKVADGLLAALHLIGITEVYRIGGVHAIGAMSYGTKTIPAVDKVFGPGNAYTCEAKRQVFGTVGVDSLPGPSEVMVIADDSARADFAAADLLAQAEHGSGREKIYLVGTSRAIIDAIQAEVARQLPTLGRNEKAARVLDVGFLGLQVASLDEAIEIANFVAPEHLELLVKPTAAKRLVRDITTAGAIMIGNLTPTALGDFTAGPSHVLPTGRAGRFFSGLRVADFLRRTSIIRYDQDSIQAGARVVAAFARMERLDAHGRSATIRVED